MTASPSFAIASEGKVALLERLARLAIQYQPGWWNGRHAGLKILWPLRLCGFKSRSGYWKRVRVRVRASKLERTLSLFFLTLALTLTLFFPFSESNREHSHLIFLKTRTHTRTFWQRVATFFLKKMVFLPELQPEIIIFIQIATSCNISGGSPTLGLPSEYKSWKGKFVVVNQWVYPLIEQVPFLPSPSYPDNPEMW